MKFDGNYTVTFREDELEKIEDVKVPILALAKLNELNAGKLKEILNVFLQSVIIREVYQDKLKLSPIGIAAFVRDYDLSDNEMNALAMMLDCNDLIERVDDEDAYLRTIEQLKYGSADATKASINLLDKYKDAISADMNDDEIEEFADKIIKENEEVFAKKGRVKL